MRRPVPPRKHLALGPKICYLMSLSTAEQNPGMIVMKFGGTSVQDAESISGVAGIISREQVRSPLIVVSACAGVTNALISLAQQSARGDIQQATAALTALQKRHLAIADALSGDGSSPAGAWSAVSVRKKVDEDCRDLERFIHGLAVIRELTPRTLDHFASFGEQWSSLLLAHELARHAMPATLVDARGVMVTDQEFTRAAPLFDQTESRAQERILPLLQQGRMVITQGFIGATPDGLTTTIGRGGSDYSAAIFGAALDAEEIQIWTDVDGVLSADPSLVPKAHRIRRLTFAEASELAYFGAKVLHPSTILPAIRKNIPVRVLNSKRPTCDGTWITNSSVTLPACIVKSIAHKRHISVITVQSTRMLMAHGFLSRLFDVFADHQKSIDVIATSEVGVSLTIDDSSELDSIIRELQRFAEVRVDDNRAVVCVVAEGMRASHGIASRVFAALDRAGTKVELISHGGSEINLTFVIHEEQIQSAVTALHEEFFADVSAWPEVFE